MKLRALAWLLAAALPVSVAATLPGPPVLIVTEAWVRKAPGVDTAAVYLSLSNSGAKPVIVVGVQSPAAANSMIHESSVRNGQAMMRMKDKIVIVPGQKVSFAPGGLHIMLSGLKSTFAIGQSVPLVLLTSDGAQVAVVAVVKPLVP